MRSLFGGQQKQTPQSQLKELLHKVSEQQTAKISPQVIPYFMKYTQNIDLAGELVLSLTDHIDANAGSPTDVLKALQILFYALSKSHDTVLPAAQAFAPEIATIFLLSFEKSNCTMRDAVHLLTRAIYNHLIKNEPLPSLESYGLAFDVPSQPQQRRTQQQGPTHRAPQLGRSNMQQQSQNQPPARKQEDSNSLFDWQDNDDAPEQGNGEEFGDMVSFDDKPAPQPKQSSEMNLPEQDRPRAPAAFAAFANGGKIGASNLPRGDEALLSFGDDDAEPAPKRDAVDDLLGNNQFGSFADAPEDKGGDQVDIFGLSGGESMGTRSQQSNQEIFDPFAGEDVYNSKEGYQAAPDGPADDDNDFLGSQEVAVEDDTFDPFGDEKPAGKPQAPPSKGSQDPNIFDPFAGSKADNDESFDPFGDMGQKVRERITSADTADPLPKSLPASSNDTFDPFGDVAPKSSSGPKPPSGDGFDPFPGAPSSKPASGPKPPSGDGFDPFPGAQPAASNDDDTFDPFTNIPSKQQPKQQPQQQKPRQQPQKPAAQPAGNDDTFDPFSNIGSKQQPQKAAAPSNDDTFDPFGNAQPAASSDTFDPFPGAPSSKPASGPKPPSGDGFDPFSNIGSKPQQQQQKPAPQQQKPMPKSDDMFDPFADSVPSTTKPPASSNVLDMLGAAPASPKPQPKASTDAFDMFGAAPASAKPSAPQPKGSADAFDMLSGSNPPSKQSSQSAFDLFGSDSKPAPSPAARQQPPARQKPAPSPAARQQLPAKQQPADDTFDPFADQVIKTPAIPNQRVPQQQQRPQQRPAPKTEDMFDPFAGMSAPQAPKQSSDAFDMFGAAPAPAAKPAASSNTFEMFGAAPAPSKPQANASSNAFDMFGTAPASAKPTAPKPSSDAFEVFGSSAGRGPARPQPQQQRPMPQQPRPMPQQQRPQQAPSGTQPQSLRAQFAAQQQQQPQRPQQKLLGASNQQQNQGSKGGNDVFDMLGF